MSTSIIALFCCLDDFAKAFEEWERHRLIGTGRQRSRSGKLSLSERLFIMVPFHLSPFKSFKAFRFDAWSGNIATALETCRAADGLSP